LRNGVTAGNCTIASGSSSSCTIAGPISFSAGQTVEVSIQRSSSSGAARSVSSIADWVETTVTALSTPHFTVGSIANVGTAGTAVTFSGSSAFTSASSYYCSATNSDSSVAVRVRQDSGSQITLFVNTSTDTVSYMCVGN
jgi:hypothetical protein